jgi:hypothetical protein
LKTSNLQSESKIKLETSISPLSCVDNDHELQSVPNTELTNKLQYYEANYNQSIQDPLYDSHQELIEKMINQNKYLLNKSIHVNNIVIVSTAVVTAEVISFIRDESGDILYIVEVTNIRKQLKWTSLRNYRDFRKLRDELDRHEGMYACMCSILINIYYIM